MVVVVVIVVATAAAAAVVVVVVAAAAVAVVAAAAAEVVQFIYSYTNCNFHFKRRQPSDVLSVATVITFKKFFKLVAKNTIH